MADENQSRYAVVTGAAGGIGSAAAKALIGIGTSGVIFADLDDDKAAAAAAKLESETGRACLAVRTDVSKPESIRALFKTTLEKFGSVHILVNCAGVCPVGDIEEIDETAWDRVMAINLRSAYLCAREALIIMKPQRYGKIISVSSISGRVGGIATGINYVTSKGAIISMTMALAKSAGPFGINVNCVAPGFIDTEMTKNFKHFDPMTVPMRRIGKPEDVASLIAFLASDKSSYITGCTIDVNGGVYMG